MATGRYNTPCRLEQGDCLGGRGVDDQPIVLDEIVDAALPRETHRMLSESGPSMLDVLEGNVPSLDPVEIITEVWERALEDDEYERCMRLLPDLLAEYGYPIE
jgi:hypothetical protein